MVTANTKSPKKGHITIDSEFCKGCGICIHFCPKGCIELSEVINASGYTTAAPKDNGQCTGCAMCALVCAEAVIEVYRG